MKYNPRKRTSEADEYILAVLAETKEMHARNLATGQAVQAEIQEQQRQAFYESIVGYKAGWFVWFCVVLAAYLFIK